MNVISRGIRNAFRNQVRTISIVIILGLSIGLCLTMLVAHRAVGQKITSVKENVGNTITISPAGFGGGFGSGGNPITETELAKIDKLADVKSISESLTDRVTKGATTGSSTNLTSAISLGSLGQRFGGFGGGFGGGNSSSISSSIASRAASITVVGTNNPSEITTGGGFGGGASTDSSSLNITNGKTFAGDSTSDVAIVGKALATKNNLKVGSTFTAYETTLTVAGIYNSGTTFGNNEVILPLATEQKLSGETGDVTSAKVTVNSVTDLSSVTTAIKNTLGSSVADVTDDETSAEETIQPLQDVSSISLYSLIGAVIAGGVIVFLTMIMIVRERRREIGIFKAIGASNLKVMLQFMSEAVTLTLLGAVVGILLGVIAGNPVTKLLVNNSSSSSSSSSTFTPGGITSYHHGGSFGFVHNSVSNINAAVGWSIIVYGILAALAIAIIGSTAVSFWISKIRPAEVMRSE
jgi:putative ABC transport system permease protein